MVIRLVPDDDTTVAEVGGYTLEPFQFDYGMPVEKYTGEAKWEGVIVSCYHTTKGKARYVVEVFPQGFQMIAVGSQLRQVNDGARSD